MLNHVQAKNTKSRPASQGMNDILNSDDNENLFMKYKNLSIGQKSLSDIRKSVD